MQFNFHPRNERHNKPLIVLTKLPGVLTTFRAFFFEETLLDAGDIRSMGSPLLIGLVASSLTIDELASD